MEQTTGLGDHVPTPAQVDAVVHITPVSGTPACARQASLTERCHMVRDGVLRLTNEVHQLTDTTIADGELAHELPTHRIAEHSENFRRMDRTHSPNHISSYCIKST
jgi:hypothetical protein